MRCKHCEYRLWGVPARACPECGSHFLPSEYEFVPNSIRFCCPHCGQDYYGTTALGHLSPPQFDCVQCHQPVSMDEMTLFPTAGLEEEQTQVEQMPWQVRGRIGFFRAWFRTIYMGMLSPTRLISLTPPGSSVTDGLLFASLTAGLAAFCGILPFIALPMFVIGSRGIGVLGGGSLSVLIALLWPILLISAWATTTHLVLAATGKHEYGARRTFQALCYSAAPNVLLVVPCMIVYTLPIAWIWWSIIAIFMVRNGQRTGGMRATGAVLSLPLVMAAGLAAFISFVAVPHIKSAQQSMTTAQQARVTAALQTANRDLMAAGLSTHALGKAGRPPGHASELIATGAVPAINFVHGSWSQVAPAIPVADVNLQEFGVSSAQKELAQAAAQSLPPNVMAHRLGDFVFTYHGIDFKKADPGLWTFVLAPEDPKLSTGLNVHVGLTDGKGSALPAWTFSKELSDQNALRAKHGLPSLPDPRTVTHTQPAIAP